MNNFCVNLPIKALAQIVHLLIFPRFHYICFDRLRYNPWN